MEVAQEKNKQSSAIAILSLFIISIVISFYIFNDGLAEMLNDWQKDEYSHGYMIPIVALYLVWQKINLLPAATHQGSWLGVLILLSGLIFWLLGDVSAIFVIVQYGLLIVLTGLIMSIVGRSGTLLFWAAIVYLCFMIPLPVFLYQGLSANLQQISSVLGVAVIRLFDISVNLEGNVIDLGAMQLQVAEACNGLRYLFPLLSFGFLIAYLYRGPLWHKVLIFLSTMPITVLMNSLRIGLIGVSVEYWGIEMAEGVLHDFEGWVVFMACLAVLFLEMSVLNAISKSRVPVLDQLNLDTPDLSIKLKDFNFSFANQKPLIVSFLLICAAIPLKEFLGERLETPPVRKEFVTFPLAKDNWIGQELSVEKNILNTLQLTDYFSVNYANNAIPASVNLWIAYYASQRKGASIHSPRSCLPGGGWKIESLAQFEIDGVMHPSGKPLRVNRALIKKDGYTQVVYYWFDGRGRNITNEYAAKWYIFEDAMTKNRTDGALIRVITMVDDPSKIAAADKTLTTFLQNFYPLLPAYIP